MLRGSARSWYVAWTLVGTENTMPRQYQIRRGFSRLESRHRERTLIELLKRESLRLRYEEQYEHEADDIPCSVPPKRALRAERAEKPRECDGDNEVATIAHQQRVQRTV